MKVYRGAILTNLLNHEPEFGPVTVEDLATGTITYLPHEVKHSADGFSWGYGGSGPAELARCLLLDVFPDKRDEVEQLHQSYKNAVIGRLDRHRAWKISENEVRTWAFNKAQELGLTLEERPALPEEKMADPDCSDRLDHRLGIPCPTCGGTP